MISAEEARTIILSATTEIQSESVALLESHNRTLAMDVRAEDDIPPFRNSSMDGFALRSNDTIGSSTNNIVEMKLLGEVAAGKISTFQLRRCTLCES